MTYIWDTNILLNILRQPNFYDTLNQRYDFTNPLNEVQISAVTFLRIMTLLILMMYFSYLIKSLSKK